MKMLIDSRWVEATDGQYFEVFNPATGAIFDRVPHATIEDARLALDAAHIFLVFFSAKPNIPHSNRGVGPTLLRPVSPTGWKRGRRPIEAKLLTCIK